LCTSPSSDSLVIFMDHVDLVFSNRPTAEPDPALKD
jgi:hypothetical protein